MSTVATLIENTRRHLQGQHRSLQNRLNGALDASQTTVTFELALTGLARGSVIAVEDELMFVISTDDAMKQAVVIRGFWETTAATHADDSLVEVNPRFPAPLIRKELKSEILSWMPALFAVKQLSLTVGASDRGVDLTGIDNGWLHLLRVLRDPTTTIGTAWVEVRPCRMERNMPVESFASGHALFLPAALGSSHTLLVDYATPFDVSDMSDALDVQTDLLVADYMEDVAEYGAAWRMVIGREVRRTFTEGQGEPRNAAEVPPGAIISTARALKVLRDERLADAARRLHHLWGVQVNG